MIHWAILFNWAFFFLMTISHLLVLDVSKKKYDYEYGLKKSREKAKKNIKKGAKGKLDYLRDLDTQRDKGVLPFAYFWALLFVGVNIGLFSLAGDLNLQILLFAGYVWVLTAIFTICRLNKFEWYRTYYVWFMFSFIFFMFHITEYEPLWLFDWRVNPVVVLLLAAVVGYIMKSVRKRWRKK